MCGIGGIKGEVLTKKSGKYLNLIAEKLAYRGSHATGIGYLTKRKKFSIRKAPISPLNIDFKTLMSFGDELVGDTIIFHNRFTTHGSQTKNKNNHPFLGDGFILAHNGVLSQYAKVLSDEKITVSPSEPETDSYAIVLLINKYKKEMKFEEALKKACLNFIGSSLCLEILDKNDNLYLVRGDTYSFDLTKVNSGYIWTSSSNYTSCSYQTSHTTDSNIVSAIVEDLLPENEINVKKIAIPKYSITKITSKGILRQSIYYSEPVKKVNYVPIKCGNHYNNYEQFYNNYYTKEQNESALFSENSKQLKLDLDDNKENKDDDDLILFDDYYKKNFSSVENLIENELYYRGSDLSTDYILTSLYGEFLLKGYEKKYLSNLIKQILDAEETTVDIR